MLLRLMAAHLDQDPKHVVLQIANLPITQDDLAGVIRSMPPNMGDLSGTDIYRRALDVMIRQKAMVMPAKEDHLDQDPALIHPGQVAFERIISDAWLKRRADAGVTDKALHALYDRDYAGKPGPEEVGASVILVPPKRKRRRSSRTFVTAPTSPNWRAPAAKIRPPRKGVILAI